MKGKFLNERGSTLILMIMVITLTIGAGIALLSVTMINYKISVSRKIIKQSLYMAELGINNSYVRAYRLTEDAVSESLKKSNEYLADNPADYAGAEIIFKDNYKLFVQSQINSRVSDIANPNVQILNLSTLYFDTNTMTASIMSKYQSDKNDMKAVSAKLIFKIPNYYEAADGKIIYKDIVSLKNWNTVGD